MTKWLVEFSVLSCKLLILLNLLCSSCFCLWARSIVHVVLSKGNELQNQTITQRKYLVNFVTLLTLNLVATNLSKGLFLLIIHLNNEGLTD